MDMLFPFALFCIGHDAQDHQRLCAGVDDTVAVTPGAVMAQARAHRHLRAVVQAHPGAGQEVHDLAAVLMGVQTDGCLLYTSRSDG